ncbi:MAG: hypothetical protein AAB347_05520 [Bacteroidota bacterium]
MRTFRAILSFYNSFAFLGFLLTAACLTIVFTNGIVMFTILFWFKIGTMWLIYYFTDSYKSKEYYYYDLYVITNGKTYLTKGIEDLKTLGYIK